MFALALMLISPQAHALSCEEGPVAYLPDNSATDVPVTVIPVVESVFTAPSTYEVALREAEGDIVATDIVDIEVGGDLFRQLVPWQVLDSNTTYELYSAEGDWVMSSFTTGIAEDVDAPGAVSISSISGEHHKGEWGPSTLLSLTIDSTDADGDVYFELEITADDSIDTVYQMGSQGTFGGGPCLSNFTGLTTGATVEVRARAIDTSGNVGDWSDPSFATIVDTTSVDEEDNHVGCSVAPAGALGVGWLLALAGIAARRRL